MCFFSQCPHNFIQQRERKTSSTIERRKSFFFLCLVLSGGGGGKVRKERQKINLRSAKGNFFILFLLLLLPHSLVCKLLSPKDSKKPSVERGKKTIMELQNFYYYRLSSSSCFSRYVIKFSCFSFCQPGITQQSAMFSMSFCVFSRFFFFFDVIAVTS